MDLDDLLDLCKAYSDLGSAVQEQLHTLVDHGDRANPDDLNMNAVKMIVDEFLTDASKLQVAGAETAVEVALAWLAK